jgi:murein DD-endopeptidase MepM/ murein hydrolase activator NlpD
MQKHTWLKLASSVALLALMGCASGAPAPVVEGKIQQVWGGRVAAKNTATANQEPATSLKPSTPLGQPVAPLLQEEDLEAIKPAAGPARPVAIPVATTAAPNTTATTYTIQPTDTLFKIARAHNTTPTAIMQANGLADVADLAPGRVLTIPANTKSTMPSLAESINAYLTTPPQAGAKAGAQAGGYAATPATAPATAVAVARAPRTFDVARIEPAAGTVKTVISATATRQKHAVKAGETIYRISKQYGVEVLDIMAVNELAKPEELRAGMVLNIPAAPAAKPEEQVVASTLRAVAPVKAAVTASNGSLRPAADLGVTDTTRATIAAQREITGTRPLFDPDKGTDTAASMQPLKDIKPQTDKDRLKAEMKRGTVDREAAVQNGLIWPVRGNVVKQFGDMGSGVAHTGINIAVPVGTPVLATETGTVLYADEGLRSYGKMVLLRHSNGMVSAYAHNSHLLVRRGERVQKGQVVAMSGQSGNVESPQLHFELRRNATAINPQTALR